jgi:CBS domain-containing protein
MTKNPTCVTADTSAQDALNLMVSRGFRHLVKQKKKKSFDNVSNNFK